MTVATWLSGWAACFVTVACADPVGSSQDSKGTRPVSAVPTPPLLPAPLTRADAIGTYDLVRIAWSAFVPPEPLPAWTFPGRVLVLEGSTDGSYHKAGRSRTTMFGDTTYRAFSGVGVWEWFPDSIVFPTTLQFPLDAARVERELLTIFSGGFRSGGTLLLYRKRKA